MPASAAEAPGRESIDVSRIAASALKYFPCARRNLFREAVMSAHSNSGINPIAKAKTRAAIFLAAAALIFSAPAARAQQSPKPPQGAAPQNPGSMPGMDMNDMQHDADQNPEAARDANDAMSGHDMDMGGMDMNPHMFMTELQPKQPGDAQRAEEIVEILGKSIAKYKDYRVALADGYRIFLPNYPQKQYHFTNYHNAFVAGFVFNPAHPTSLLYTKTKDGYELQGAMFTAPKSATEQQLNERVPLSVARWHAHVIFCLAPRGATAQQRSSKEFGLAGSIVTQDACAQAGGRWIKQIFGWMVHVYPYETDPDKVWAH
jgi:hypothetical protein